MQRAEKDPKRTLTLDVEKYQAELNGSGMSDAEKEAYLQVLWNIIVACVELGMPVHSVENICGKPEYTDNDTGVSSTDLLEFLNCMKTEETERCASLFDDAAKEGSRHEG